ncbi:MAG: PGF-CTERM archaeal protein-sorting signal, partial [halophilic archaeon J07HX5]
LVGDEWAGSSNVLSGEDEGVDIIAERVPDDGEFNEFPIDGQDSYVAMIHFVNDDTTAGTEASPGSFPVLPNVNGGEGVAPGGVTTQAQVTAQVDDDGGDTAAGDGDGGDAGDSDGGGPGFGIGGAVAALGGLGYAIRRRLDDDNGAE